MSFAASLALLTFIQAGAPASISLQPSELALELEESVLVSVVMHDGAGQGISVPLRWFSGDTAVAVVDAEGRVTAVGVGLTRIVAAAGAVSGVLQVMVTDTRPFFLEASGPPTILAGTTVPIVVVVATRAGDPVPNPPLRFSATPGDVLRVAPSGLVTASAPGSGTVTVRVGALSSEVSISVVENRASSYGITPASSVARTGDVIRLELDAYVDGGVGAGPTYPRWFVAGAGAQIEREGTQGVFVAEQPGRYEVTAVLADDIVRTSTIDVAPRESHATLELTGRGAISTHNSGDMWVFEGVDGRDYVYIGTFMHDWMKVWDVTDPSAPTLTDSLQMDARRINDIKIHPNKRIGIATREGASSRRNGIMILDLSDPAHPVVLSEYTATVTGGVHNVWIRGDQDLVYAIHNGTSEMHIIDIGDPANPREVGRWGLEKRMKSLHDVIVQEGYAYLSYWDDGIITLDVGAGTHGGTPTAPAFVSQYKYPVGNTHVAWRAGRYLFVGDEIFPPGWNSRRPIEARGYIRVIDMDDMDNPVEVAHYEVPEAGAHNVWVEGDRLYVGYYQAGIRVVDISGELRGDLYRQGREVASMTTADEHSVVPNWPMTWSTQVFKGHIFSSDMNSGLWVTKLREVQLVP
jgi:hypothetical protein